MNLEDSEKDEFDTKLREREIKEEEERKKKQEEEEEQKFDFSALLQDTSKKFKKGKYQLMLGRRGIGSISTKPLGITTISSKNQSGQIDKKKKIQQNVYKRQSQIIQTSQGAGVGFGNTIQKKSSQSNQNSLNSSNNNGSSTSINGTILDVGKEGKRHSAVIPPKKVQRKGSY